jgi:hypothetical protein
VRSRAERTAHAFSMARCGMMTPLHATSALSGAGPRGSALDLAVTIAKGDQLTYEVVGRTARDRVRDVDPRNTSVSVGGSPHKVGSVLDGPVKLEVDWRRVECGLEGRALSELPVLGLRRDVRDVDVLEKGGRRDRGGLEGHDARDGYSNFFFFFFGSMGFISKSTLGVILIVPPPLHHLALRKITSYFVKYNYLTPTPTTYSILNGTGELHTLIIKLKNYDHYIQRGL